MKVDTYRYCLHLFAPDQHDRYMYHHHWKCYLRFPTWKHLPIQSYSWVMSVCPKIWFSHYHTLGLTSIELNLHLTLYLKHVSINCCKPGTETENNGISSGWEKLLSIMLPIFIPNILLQLIPNSTIWAHSGLRKVKTIGIVMFVADTCSEHGFTVVLYLSGLHVPVLECVLTQG